jgi:biopolymer transport protein ExbD
MTLNGSNTKSMNSEINVTPMIDVLLVLLIIFMVIVPAIPKGESASTPKPRMDNERLNLQTVLLEVSKGSGGDLTFKINQQLIAKKDLPSRLASIYANRAERVLFLKGDNQLSFTEGADVIDISHAAGIDHVGLMTPKVLAGQ